MSGYRAPASLRLAGAGAVAATFGLGAGAAQADAAAELAAANAQPTTVEGVEVIGRRLNEHPYGDPEAPYKTDRSASSKLTEPLLDVSKSITVLSDQVIEDSGARTFRDLMRTQPGVTLGTGEGGNAFGDRIFIRGFDARNDVYVDGVRDPGVGSRETFAVEQIEIFKGPSSAFGGRGTTGGAVSLISKSPQNGNFGDVELTAGTEDTWRATVDLNRRLTDSLSLRVNAMVHQSGVAGRDHVYNDRWGVAAALRWRPVEQLTVVADYFHLTTDELPDWGVPYDVAENRPFQVPRDNFYGILDRDFRKTFADIYTLRGTFAVNEDVTLNSVLRYGQSGNAYTASAPERPDATAGTVSANAKRRDAVVDYLVNQSDVTVRFNTGGVEHALVAGYELSGESVLNRGRAFAECATLPCTGSSVNPVQDLWNPNPARPWTVTDNGIVNRTNIDVETRAVFVLDTLTLNPQWELFGGLRYDTYDVDLRQVAVATGVVTERQSSSDFWNWHAGVVFKPRPNGSIYLSYGSSSNPSGEQLDSTGLDYGGLDPRTVNLDPERNKALEFGTKWNLFDEHLQVTAALFRIDKTDARVAVGAGAGAVVVLDGESRVQGFEVTAAGEITPDWSVFGGFTLLDTEITDSPNAAQVGSKFPNVAETSFSLTSRHQVTDRLHLGGTVIHTGERFGGTVTAMDTYIPGYWRLDLFGGYRLTDRVEVTFNVLNVSDELYYDSIYRSATPFTYVAPGRSAMVTLDIDF